MSSNGTGSRRLVHISRLRAHPANIRQDLGDLSELADSIRAQGILQPLVVAPGDEPDTYVVLAGHRRLAAAQQTTLDMIPVTVREGADPYEVMLVENCQRSDLSPVDKAEAIDGLVRAGRTLRQIGKAIRAWALEQGLVDQVRGRIPHSVVARYEAAQAGGRHG